MKAAVLILLTGFILPNFLSAQERNIKMTKEQAQKEIARKQKIAPGVSVQQQKGRASTAPAFKVNDPGQTRKQMPDYKPVPIGNVIERITSNSGNQAYSTGNGVILDALNIQDSVTKSSLYLSGISYGPFESEQIKTHTSIPFSIFVGSYPNGEITAEFKDLSTTSHLYLLTLGTSAGVNNTIITVYGSRTGPGITFDTDKLVTTPGSSEIRLLFTFNSVYDNQFGLTVKVDFTYPENNKEVFFNFMQLARLD
jgi:hypothetical protein